MSQLLRSNQQVTTQPSGLVCTVEQFLGGGGQGEVYRAQLAGRTVALKWYFPVMATPEHRLAMESLIRRGPPTDRFLWPMELAVSPEVANFGYVMPLREPQYKGIVDMMVRRVEPSFRALATAGLELADNFLQLHSRGLCYRDISFGNVFFDPDTGHVLICDNDNVAVDGNTVGGVLGTPDFMAPEIVRGEAVPSTRTDLYSLAVLLFYMFHLHHPLFGKRVMEIRCLDLAARVLLCGKEPLFIFDPVDTSNQAVPRSVDPYGEAGDNALAYWPIYPQFLRDLFTQAFTEGLRDPDHGRVRESQWRSAMARLRDSIVYCAGCSAENFYDAESLQKSGGQTGLCWSCSARLTLPPRIRIGKNIIMLNHDTKLFPHHLDDKLGLAFNEAVAEVTRHPSNPGIWGLRNLSGASWTATPAEGDPSDVEPGRSVTLAVGTKINFGASEGEIRL
jgi:DNA-binding helix-hairpin-helix protein with protein kinase domain